MEGQFYKSFRLFQVNCYQRPSSGLTETSPAWCSLLHLHVIAPERTVETTEWHCLACKWCGSHFWCGTAATCRAASLPNTRAQSRTRLISAQALLRQSQTDTAPLPPRAAGLCHSPAREPPAFATAPLGCRQTRRGLSDRLCSSGSAQRLSLHSVS